MLIDCCAAVALLIAHWPAMHLGFAPVSLLLCAVMLSACVGGVGPGLVATILSAAVFYYGFLPPVFSVVAKPGQTPRFVVFVASAVLVGSLSAAQRRVTEKLRRACDKLEQTVQELKRVNDALGKSEAYLAEPQTLSHTHSFGWGASTGELVWSEETFRIFEYDRTIKPAVALVHERIHPEDVERVQQAFTAIAQNGSSIDLEHRLLIPDGSVKTVRVLGHTAMRLAFGRFLSER